MVVTTAARIIGERAKPEASPHGFPMPWLGATQQRRDGWLGGRWRAVGLRCWRAQWEFGHTDHFVVTFAGLLALPLATVRVSALDRRVPGRS
jgi:hypothetical protein